MPGSEGEREKPKIHPIICTSEAQSGVQRSTQHYFSPALLNGSPVVLQSSQQFQDGVGLDFRAVTNDALVSRKMFFPMPV